VRDYETSPRSGDGDAAALEKVILLGGPPDLPTDVRLQWVSRFETRIKICHYGGYEHFEREPVASDDGLPAFRWADRTKVAE